MVRTTIVSFSIYTLTLSWAASAQQPAQFPPMVVVPPMATPATPGIQRQAYGGLYQTEWSGNGRSWTMTLELREQNGVVSGRVNALEHVPGGLSQSSGYPTQINANVAADGSFNTSIGDSGGELRNVRWCGSNICTEGSSQKANSANLVFRPTTQPPVVTVAARTCSDRAQAYVVWCARGSYDANPDMFQRRAAGADRCGQTAEEKRQACLNTGMFAASDGKSYPSARQ